MKELTSEFIDILVKYADHTRLAMNSAYYHVEKILESELPATINATVLAESFINDCIVNDEHIHLYKHLIIHSFLSDFDSFLLDACDDNGLTCNTQTTADGHIIYVIKK